MPRNNYDDELKIVFSIELLVNFPSLLILLVEWTKNQTIALDGVHLST